MLEVRGSRGSSTRLALGPLIKKQRGKLYSTVSKIGSPAWFGRVRGIAWRGRAADKAAAQDRPGTPLLHSANTHGTGVEGSEGS